MSNGRNNTSPSTSNCPRCTNSPWIQRAQQFINQNQSNTDPYIAYRVNVLQELLQRRAFGYCCGVSINDLMQAVRFTQSRENFQHNVLIPLKREGIIVSLVYPGNCGAVFIPCDCSDIGNVLEQYINRIESEIENNIRPLISALR